MDMFLRETIRSSPTKSRTPLKHQPSNSFDTSFISDTSYECCYTNPETGLLYSCRRSPRLLANGYYVLTEDSVVTDDQGNLTVSPAQTSISYKENLSRIFPRRRKTRRSFATLLNDISQSLLSKSIFGSDGTLSSPKISSYLDINSSTKQDTFVSFTYDNTTIVPLKDKDFFFTCDGFSLWRRFCSCFTCSVNAVFKKAFFVLLFTLCICANMFSRYLCAGIVAVMAFIFLILSICGSKSRKAHANTNQI